MPRGGPKTPKEAAIVADLAAGMSQIDASRKHGVHKSTVRRIYWDHIEEMEAREDMTMAEVEALIAEQRPTMPEDWSDGPRSTRPPQAVQRGMGVRASRNTRRDVR